jgi:hypothetical protein
MFVHSVYFWLKEGLSDAEVVDFLRGMNSLREIESVRQFHAGPPADTDRPVIDRSYSYGMLVVLDDAKGHDVYQEHPAHDAFRQNCARYWSRVLIYDFES